MYMNCVSCILYCACEGRMKNRIFGCLLLAIRMLLIEQEPDDNYFFIEVVELCCAEVNFTIKVSN